MGAYLSDMGDYFLLGDLDDGERDLVTFSTEPFLTVGLVPRTIERFLTIGLLPRITRRAWRVSICVRPPGTRARTTAWPMRGGTVTPPWPKTYSLSHQLGTNFPLKRRSPSKL